MVRLIDAKVLERQVKATFKDSNPVLMGQMLRWIRCQTTVDAVTVVRCKNCASRVYDKASNEHWCNNPGGLGGRLRDDTFCPYGERKDDNG